MKKKDRNFLDDKMIELVDKNIISREQYNTAMDYFNNVPQDTKSVSNIFWGIGTLLIALSIITLFAINWNYIPKEIKVIISFVPIVITSIMLYFTMKNNNKSLKICTGIFAPISILATNALVTQVFHIQTQIYEMLFISLIMFLPIVLIIRNYITIVVYGIGTIIYAFSAMDSDLAESLILVNVLITACPLIIYNIINYIKNKDDSKNYAMWIVNIILITLFSLRFELIRWDSIIVYIYMLYMLTLILFSKDKKMSKILSFILTACILVSCISPVFLSYVDELKIGIDTVVLLVLTGVFFYLSKEYKNINQYFTLIFVLLVQFSKFDASILCIIINILVIIYGINKIIIGNKNNMKKEIKQGTTLIILPILFRFMSSDLSFGTKSIIFLIAGVGFMIGAKLINNKNNGREGE